MNPVFVKRLMVLDSLKLTRLIQLPALRSYSSKSNKIVNKDPTGLDSVVSYICCHMRRHGSLETDLLILDNPANVDVVKKFKKAGVKRIACTVKDERHFNQIQEQLKKSKRVVHYDLLSFHKIGTTKLSKANKQEEQIISSIRNNSGLVILASGVSDRDNLDIHRSLTNRIMTRETDGFYSIPKIDWFIALSENSVKMKKHLQSHHAVVTLLNSFYKHRNCITMSYDDSCKIFHNNLSLKKLKQTSQKNIVSHQRKVSIIKENNVCIAHFTPRFDVLGQFNLEEREGYRKFMRMINGPQRLIPALEKLVPGCGLGLIELGYGMADEVHQITHDQFLQLYKDVRGLPEYEGSALHHLLSGNKVQEEDDQLDYSQIMGHRWIGND